MGKSRLHYFKVKPGDDARLFDDADIETEGFIARLRRKAHDCTPYGFLVDPRRQRPYDAKKIADIVHLTNNRATVVMAEAHLAGLLKTAAELRAEMLANLGGKNNKKAKSKLDVFDEMCREIPSGVSLSEIFVIPTLVEDYVDVEAHRRFGKGGGSPVLLRFKAEQEAAELEAVAEADAVAHFHEVKAGVNPQSADNAQSQKSSSEVRGQRSSSSSETTGEREASATRARADLDEKPMTWVTYTARCNDVGLWQKSQPERQSEEAFDAAFEARFQMSWAVWTEIKRRMEGSIPSPCRDGYHVFEPGTTRCSYCPHLRMGEETA